MEALTTIATIQAGIEALKQLKQMFVDDRRTAESHKNTHEKMSSLADQVESNKAAIEKLNDVLLSLSEAGKEATIQVRKIKYLVYASMIISLASISISAYFLIR